MVTNPSVPTGRSRAVWLLVIPGVLYAASVIWVSPQLPDVVPTHWSGSTPDGWSTRTGFLVMCVALGVGLLLMFGLILRAFARSKTMWGLNVPNREFWAQPEHIEQARVMARTDVAAIGGLTILLLSLVPLSILQASRSADQDLPTWMLATFFGYLGCILIYLICMVLYRWSVPKDAHPTDS